MGRYFGTTYGEEALDWYVQQIVEKENYAKWYELAPYYAGAGFSALWTENTWYLTAAVLAVGYIEGPKIVAYYTAQEAARKTSEGAGRTVRQGFETFNDAKKALGSPGQGNQWHHIVEQSQINKSGFSTTQIQNTNNLIAVDSATHAKISGYYNSIDAGLSDTMRVRDWLAGQSLETQYQFGMDVLNRFGVTK